MFALLLERINKQIIRCFTFFHDRLLREEGLFVGSSSAMNIVGAIRTAIDLPPGSNVVTVICDSGQRYLTRFWNRDFIVNWGLEWPQDVRSVDGENKLPDCIASLSSIQQ